jgi:hypothetical protein
LLREVSKQCSRGLLTVVERAVECPAEVERIDAETAEEGGLGASVLVLDVMLDADRRLALYIFEELSLPVIWRIRRVPRSGSA